MIYGGRARCQAVTAWPGSALVTASLLCMFLTASLSITRCSAHSATWSLTMASANAPSLPHLEPGEVSLLSLATDNPRDTLSLSDRESLVLQLYNQIQEQKLEKALLEQGTATVCAMSRQLLTYTPESESLSGNDAEEQLAIAERELLQSRATYTVRRKAVGMVLMTDPTLKAVHMKATSPAER